MIINIHPFPEHTSYAEIVDDHGYHWIYDEEDVRSLYLVDAKDFPDSGYYCRSFREAIQILVDGGYIESFPS